jgi:small basic protein (TIGR04137 family)
MSLHRSLKTQSGALNQHRSVLTRVERIAKLMEADKFESGENSPIGIPKVANRKLVTKKKK